MKINAPQKEIQEFIEQCQEEVASRSCILKSLNQAGISFTTDQLENWQQICDSCASSLNSKHILALLHNSCMKAAPSCFLNLEKIKIFKTTSEEARRLLTNCYRCMDLS
ncbi:MAG: hypothetical protein QNL04_01525 [SAR324 cluster bacterium]|nr:hypothetical protein [SAR324 cluster bacterium]